MERDNTFRYGVSAQEFNVNHLFLGKVVAVEGVAQELFGTLLQQADVADLLVEKDTVVAVDLNLELQQKAFSANPYLPHPPQGAYLSLLRREKRGARLAKVPEHFSSV